MSNRPAAAPGSEDDGVAVLAGERSGKHRQGGGADRRRGRARGGRVDMLGGRVRSGGAGQPRRHAHGGDLMEREGCGGGLTASPKGPLARGVDRRAERRNAPVAARRIEVTRGLTLQ